MSPQALLFVVAITVAAFSGFAEAFKDPHNKFCGEDECYAVLGLQRGADKADIKKAYRTISLDVHPDKNPTAAAKEKFTVRLIASSLRESLRACDIFAQELACL